MNTRHGYKPISAYLGRLRQEPTVRLLLEQMAAAVALYLEYDWAPRLATHLVVLKAFGHHVHTTIQHVMLFV